MSSTASTWVAEAAAVYAKEWRCELRTRYALNTVLLFALTTLVVVSVSLGPLGVSGTDRESVLPVLLWIIVLFAAAAGLPRTFVHEEEAQTATALRLGARPSALFAGKSAFSLSLLLVLEALVTPLFLAMMQLAVEAVGLLLAALLLGGLGLAVASTLVAAIIAQTRNKATLFAVLSFPLLLPLLLLVVELTRGAVGGGPLGVDLTQLLLYDATIVVASWMLFPAVWNPV